MKHVHTRNLISFIAAVEPTKNMKIEWKDDEEDQNIIKETKAIHAGYVFSLSCFGFIEIIFFSYFIVCCC